MIQNLITWFKVAARARGVPTLSYDYPELIGDPQKARVLQQLNEQVKSNPYFSLPIGYVLAKEQ